MKLQDLGFDSWFEGKRPVSEYRDCHVARVSAVNRDNYTVKNEETEVTAELSGKFRFSAGIESDLPAVGDWVLLNYFDSDTFAVIEFVLPRKTIIRRKAAGKKIDYQTIAANVDTAFVVQSCDCDFSPRRLERYMVALREGNVEPVILLSKSDLMDEAGLEKLVSDTRETTGNCEVIPYSTKTGIGVDEIERSLAPGKTCCLLGSSGVGKTTLVNYFLGRQQFTTGEIRRKDGKGKHTTTRRQMIILKNGAMLVDTPGLREFGNIDMEAGIGGVFPEIEKLAGGCRYKDCTHTRESGCAVIAALENGGFQAERYESYLKLRKESAYYQMSYAEKRRKDRKLGQFYKSVLKSKEDI